jgi:hypothetical protein
MSRFMETCQAFGLSKERTALAWDDLLSALMLSVTLGKKLGKY